MSPFVDIELLEADGARLVGASDGFDGVVDLLIQRHTAKKLAE